jgi:probable HAF family extracellular repeat protein
MPSASPEYAIPALWQAEQYIPLPIPASYSAAAVAINGSGTVVGSAGPIGAAGPQPAVWQNGQLALLDTGGRTFGSADSINNNGVVAGQIYDPNNFQAALWSNGQLTIVPGFSSAIAINNTGQVLVTGSAGAAVWLNGTATLIPSLGGSYLAPRAINGEGHVTGAAGLPSDADGVAFLSGNGATAALPNLPGDEFSEGFAINDSDEVVGDSGSLAGGSRAVLWENGTAIDLNTLIPADSGWFLEQAYGITNDGVIVGDGSFDGQGTSFLLTPVSAPEPASLAFFSPVAITLLRRRSRLFNGVRD